MKNEKILEVKNLTVSFKTPNGLVRAVRDVGFDLYKGETLAIVGESGSGKSVTTRAIMGILAGNAITDDGEILYRNQDLTKLSEVNFHKIRGNKIGMIFQDPLSSLNPIMKIGKQITEAMLVNGDRIKTRYHDLYHYEYHNYLNQVTLIKKIEQSIKNKAHEMRVDSELPKKEQKQIMKEYKTQKHQEIKELKKALPELKAKYHAKKASSRKQVNEEKADILLKGKEQKLELLNKLNDLKSAFALLEHDKDAREFVEQKIVKAKETHNENSIKFKEMLAELRAQTDQLGIIEKREAKINIKLDRKASRKATKDELKKLKFALRYPGQQGIAMQEILDMKQEIEDSEEAFKRILKVTKKEAYERAIAIMDEVGIPEARKRYTQFPFQFSGGMRQRIVIAIALTASPELLICDEPTTALDVTIQGQILKLIKDIKKERNLSVIFITHDLGVVANMADRVAVMYAGKIVEYGTVEDIFYEPKHPYTWALLSSVPDIETRARLLSIPGVPPDMLFPPKGDAFADRNKYALKIDFEEQPPYFKVSDTHYAATWLLHANAPKIEMPDIINVRITRYKEQIAIDAKRRADIVKRKASEGDHSGK